MSSARWLRILVVVAMAGGTGCKERPKPASATVPPPDTASSSVHLAPTNVVPYDTVGEAALDPATITPAMIAQGRQIYAGHGGASCVACHGANAEGTKNGPRLSHADWIDADGSYTGIVRVIVNGVPHPRAFPEPMPQLGAGTLTFDQVKAVGAYVYALNRKRAS